ncbi:Glycosyl hydrolase family 26 [Paenibacillus sp. 1_12]|uniref:glycoside hydrolase family 26 protein n=1 Tax=Paenibacillus sp. 1_12 TaxID=1566278 RepID=UPI0008E7C6F6|nr:glycosyl hydrolase [Paenibacillus sp. 1_12]SFL10650.1 Glycosyl hydrolase family 26 [Paenibacillus sp. 1_12]
MRKIVLVAACLLLGIVAYWGQQRWQNASLAITTLAAESDPPNSTLTWWSTQIDSAVEKQEWRLAADYTSRKAAFYRDKNELSQADTLEQLSRQYADKEPDKLLMQSASESAAISTDSHVTLEAYVSVPAAPHAQLAKFEPVTGVYLGMLGADKRVAFNWKQIEPVYGRTHAMYLTYVGWRKVQTQTNSYFPIQQADNVKAMGGSLQIGWEPRYGLDDVLDDEYVRTFAKEAKASGIPVFLRYASEMNGAWVPWYGDPVKYIEKFQLIHKIMKEEAPNVVMVWSPNFMPMDNIDAYYPGDDYVDWIGYSLYAIDGPQSASDDKSGFLQSFRPLSEAYPNKPIMISESGVSHYNLIKNESYERWAEDQLGDLYAYLPRLYPRVKAITYFNFSKERAVRSNMEAVYDLGENAFADRLYQRLIQSDFYLSQVKEQAQTKENIMYKPLTQASRSSVQGKHKVFTYVSMPHSDQPFAVGYSQAGKQLSISHELPWEVDLDFAKLDPAQPLTITAYSRSMEKLAEQQVPLPK